MGRVIVQCTDCGRECAEDSEGADALCLECWVEEHCFLCSWCEEYGDVADQHAYVLVFAPDEVGLDLAGCYRVVRLPYYAQGLIGGGWIARRCVQWMGHLPAGLEGDPDGAPCGHLCQDCQERMLQDLAERGIIHDIA